MMITKKIIAALFLCILLAALSQESIAAEKIFELKVSGCWD